MKSKNLIDESINLQLEAKALGLDWIELDKIIEKHNIKWNWVKGHANNEFNEKADFLARKFIQENS